MDGRVPDRPGQRIGRRATRAFHAFVMQGEPVRAVRAAFWLAFLLSHTGDRARAAGWAARAQRLLEECGNAVGLLDERAERRGARERDRLK